MTADRPTRQKRATNGITHTMLDGRCTTCRETEEHLTATGATMIDVIHDLSPGATVALSDDRRTWAVVSVTAAGIRIKHGRTSRVVEDPDALRVVPADWADPKHPAGVDDAYIEAVKLVLWSEAQGTLSDGRTDAEVIGDVRSTIHPDEVHGDHPVDNAYRTVLSPTARAQP